VSNRVNVTIRIEAIIKTCRVIIKSSYRWDSPRDKQSSRVGDVVNNNTNKFCTSRRSTLNIILHNHKTFLFTTSWALSMVGTLSRSVSWDRLLKPWLYLIDLPCTNSNLYIWMAVSRTHSSHMLKWVDVCIYITILWIIRSSSRV